MRLFRGVCVGLPVLVVALWMAATPVAAERVVMDFDAPPTFAYLSFENAWERGEGVWRINAETGQGGVGSNVELSLAELSNHTPRLSVRPDAANAAREVRVLMMDAEENRRMFTFELTGLPKGEFTEVLARHAQPLGPEDYASPEDAAFDPGSIATIQVQGDWQGNRTAVSVRRLSLVEPDAQQTTARDRLEAQVMRQREQRRLELAEQERRRQELLAGAHHPEDGPIVTHLLPISASLLSIEIEAQRVVNHGQTEYVPQPGDRIESRGKEKLAWADGAIVAEPMHRVLQRIPEGGDRPVDYAEYAEPHGGGPAIVSREQTLGQPLTTVTVDDSAAYRIVYPDGQALRPDAVHRKSVPFDMNRVDNTKPYRHTVYLALPRPMIEGQTYTVRFVGINTAETQAELTYQPREMRSPAVHANQIGYRPDDPFKRAFVSLWAGTGGDMTPEVTRFELIDEATGQTVYRGTPAGVHPVDRPEQFKPVRNHVAADVVHLDFHDFATPGRYRVYVEGVGCSFPFEIGRGAWADAFRKSMHGFLAHRSGIELGPPFTDYRRPRNMHPDDGFKVYRMDITRLDGEADEVDRWLREALDGSTDPSRLQEHPGAWGGYMDAGDWDRRSQHLQPTYDHLDLLDLYPDFFASHKLALPPDEANDNLPDVLNEALWNIDLYRRLQDPSGGVGGGVESSAHPRKAEASWQETLVIGVFAPDHASSYLFAANAAKAGRLMASIDSHRGLGYIDAARHAFVWAEANADEIMQQLARRSPNKVGTAEREARLWRSIAAIELYRATGDEAYHDLALTTHPFDFDKANPDAVWRARFAYVCLPNGMGDEDLKRRCLDSMIELGDRAIAFAQGNAFGITTKVPTLPMMGYIGYYSVPEMITGPLLPRLYAATGEPRFLEAALRAAHFSAGANPNNMTFTTGVGHRYPRAPLHIDSRVTGQDPPVGISVYGPSDPAGGFGFNNWVHTWHLQDVRPPSTTWPAAEGYVDMYLWPAMNEYTVHQNLGPTSFYWGFLAARADLSESN